MRSLIGVMVYATAHKMYGIIRRARREGRRVLLTVESAEGKDVEAFADECSRSHNAAQMMRMARKVGKEVQIG